MKNKIKQIFCEMPALDNTNMGLSSKKANVAGGRTREEDVQGKYEATQDDWSHIKDQDLPDGSRIEWYKDHMVSDVRGFLLSESDEIMGLIAGTTRPYISELPSFLKIHLVLVFDEHQGEGYGVALYTGALNLFGGVVSDSTLTDASLGVWKKMSKKYPVYKLAMDTKTRKYTNLRQIKDLDAEMGNGREPFIMTKKPYSLNLA